MEADLPKLVSKLQRGADGEQELDLVQAKSLGDLLDLLDHHMKQHLHYRTELDNTAGRIQSLQSQIATLITERDEARKEVNSAKLEAERAADGLREILAAVRAGVPVELCGKTYIEYGVAK